MIVANLGIGTGSILGQAQAFAPGPVPNPVAQQPADPALQKTFDIEFPGGDPTQLVEAVERAAKMPVNAIVPELHHQFYIPPLKLRNVTVPQLFEGITKASYKSEYRRSGRNTSIVTTSYGFRMSDARASTNTIWYFFVESPPQPVTDPDADPVCRFWQMEPYLQGLQIEDITTAIETGWKMLGVKPLPRLNFHKDTKLLIVVGPAGQLMMIDDVLRQLTPGPKPPRVGAVPSAPRAPSE